MKLFSPGKINLFLEIIRQREDGFHELSSHFQAISLGDTLTVVPASSDTLTCNDPTLSCNLDNLVLKAANLFRRKTGLSFFVQAHLEKKIPQQAGLGGGSSNAATMLWAMNELTNRPATLKQLMEWSDEIGSDIAFFFSSGSALCSGKGATVIDRPLSKFEGPLWIVKPPLGLSTKAVFKQFIKNSRKASRDSKYFNDLEPAAFELMPELEKFKNQLQSNFSHVLMTGSGTAFFCTGEKKEDVPDALFYKINFLSRDKGNWYDLTIKEGNF